MPDTLAPEIRTEYSRGVDLLLAGEAEQAVEVLRPLMAQDPRPEFLLALGKALLELRRGREAGECLQRLLSPDPPDSPSMRAYVLLLSAIAKALDGSPEEAMQVLDSVIETEPHLERAARSLKRRLEAGRPPVLRF
ncbi:MAG: tetratricopeptide repeat protein [Candidatus Bipolaricaulota bacterium]|nr:MAG: tetratricopeptide repeat protein [Candidatus Bipolaricaulota bacterium]